jgi:threonine dehydratase
MTPELPVTRADIDAAAVRIAPYIRRTPLWELPRGTLGGDFVPILKLELHQRAGSFKPRGAFNHLLSRGTASGSVAAASGGNHGVAVAYAAARLGLPATLFGERVGILVCGGNVDLAKLA